MSSDMFVITTVPQMYAVEYKKAKLVFGELKLSTNSMSVVDVLNRAIEILKPADEYVVSDADAVELIRRTEDLGHLRNDKRFAYRVHFSAQHMFALMRADSRDRNFLPTVVDMPDCSALEPARELLIRVMTGIDKDNLATNIWTSNTTGTHLHKVEDEQKRRAHFLDAIVKPIVLSSFQIKDESKTLFELPWSLQNWKKDESKTLFELQWRLRNWKINLDIPLSKCIMEWLTNRVIPGMSYSDPSSCTQNVTWFTDEAWVKPFEADERYPCVGNAVNGVHMLLEVSGSLLSLIKQLTGWSETEEDVVMYDNYARAACMYLRRRCMARRIQRAWIASRNVRTRS